MAKKKYTIEVEMEERWIPHFNSFLNYLESMGKLGHSCTVGFYADGDGDFRPTFKVSDPTPLVQPAWMNGNKPNLEKTISVEALFDAG